MSPRPATIVSAAAPWVVAAAMSIYILRQCRRPSGPVGLFFARLMNRTHGGLRAWALDHLSIASAASILDVGCGGGQTLHALASLAPEGKVYGVDYASASVATARSVNAALIRAGRIDVRQASVSTLPFADETFDVVTAMETHYYWPDLAHDLREIGRVLVPGGRLMIVAEAYDRGGASAMQRPIMAALKAKFLTREAHCELFESAGLIDVQAFENRSKGWLCVVGTRDARLAAPTPESTT